MAQVQQAPQSDCKVAASCIAGKQRCSSHTLQSPALQHLFRATAPPAAADTTHSPRTHPQPVQQTQQDVTQTQAAQSVQALATACYRLQTGFPLGSTLSERMQMLRQQQSATLQPASGACGSFERLEQTPQAVQARRSDKQHPNAHSMVPAQASPAQQARAGVQQSDTPSAAAAAMRSPRQCKRKPPDARVLFPLLQHGSPGKQMASKTNSRPLFAQCASLLFPGLEPCRHQQVAKFLCKQADKGGKQPPGVEQGPTSDANCRTCAGAEPPWPRQLQRRSNATNRASLHHAQPSSTLQATCGCARARGV
jgi:hypothetical protein